jgi:hypothetical protein
MNKTGIILVLLISVTQLLHAQSKNEVTSEKLKAGVRTSLGSADYSRILLKTVNVTAAQKPQVNKFIQNYMVAKNDLAIATKGNVDEYTKQQVVLFNTLKTNLATVLTKEQMDAFMAAKPKPTDKATFAMALYY